MFTPRSELIDFFAEHSLTTHGLKADAFLNRYLTTNIQKLPILNEICFDHEDEIAHIEGSSYDFDEIPRQILNLIAAKKQIDAYASAEEQLKEKRVSLSHRILHKDYDTLPEEVQAAIEILVEELSANPS